ncbi:HEAT repeat domain-containing protein [Streptomyces sp. NPDC005931]|uniref:HEAT repeat domain-containing protein n=1 Tax=Streptomyces sp. NPDC005931 TaxID=3364737 RepID=UPI0036AD60AC
MFTGIDEVDWASMRHAYGSAEDVPRLLAGLASADAVERETALDAMYGAVHHQGDVYDSTLACVPFLFALAVREEVRDRAGILELLVSIGGEPEGGDVAGKPAKAAADGASAVGAVDGHRGEDGSGGPYAKARAAVRARAGAFARLLADTDPGVRHAAPGAVVRFLDEPARVLGLLRERMTVERDDRVLLAIAESLGRFARRHPSHAADAVELLAAHSTPPYGPGLRLASLGQLAACAPERLPADLVPTVLRLLDDRARQRPRTADGPGRPDTGTLIGRLRLLRPSDEEGSRLLRTLHGALDHRVADRIALLSGQLSCPDPVDRCNAVWMSASLFRTWRADCTEPVALIGAQLDAENDRLRDAAVSVLADLFELAAPAADHLHALVVARPETRVRAWEHGARTLGGPLKALARAGDPRATPVLAEVLAGPVVPHDLGQVVPHLGRAATPLAPALRRRLAALPLDAPDLDGRAPSLLHALASLDDAASVPAMLRLLEGLPADQPTRESVELSVVRALGELGAAAREAAPVLRRRLDGGVRLATAAAAALWAVEGDAEVVLPVLVRGLEDEAGGGRRSAAETLARMGPAARPAVPALRRLARSGDLWERTAAAGALWRVTGEPEPAADVLRAGWRENPCTRTAIATLAVSLGPSAAPLHHLLHAELAAPRRHRAGPGGHGSHDIHEDERLLRLCGQALGSA